MPVTSPPADVASDPSLPVAYRAELDRWVDLAAREMIADVAAGEIEAAVGAAISYTQAVSAGAVAPWGCLARLGEREAWGLSFEELEALEQEADAGTGDPLRALMLAMLGLFARVAFGVARADLQELLLLRLGLPAGWALAPEAARAWARRPRTRPGAEGRLWDAAIREERVSAAFLYHLIREATEALERAPSDPASRALAERAAAALAVSDPWCMALEAGPPPELLHRVVDELLPRLVQVARAGGPWELAADLGAWARVTHLRDDKPSVLDDERYHQILALRNAELFAAAIDAARTWAAEEMGSAEVAFLLGNLFTESGALVPGARWLRRAFELAPADPGVRLAWATNLAQSGQPEEAYHLLEAQLAWEQGHERRKRASWELDGREGRLFAVVQNLAMSALEAGRLDDVERIAAEWVECLPMKQDMLDLAYISSERRGVPPTALWAAWEERGLVTAETLADLLMDALEGDEREEAQRLMARGEALLGARWYAGWEELEDAVRGYGLIGEGAPARRPVLAVVTG